MPITLMSSLFKKITKDWEHFWFKFEAHLPLSFVRVILGIILLWHSLDRSQFLDVYYKDTGLVKRSDALFLMLDFFRPHFSFFIWPESLITVIHNGLIFLIVLMIFGLGGRLTLFLIWFINLSFMQRNYSLLFGADLIVNIFLFYLMFTNTNRYFSLAHLFQKSKKVTAAELKQQESKEFNVTAVDFLLTSVFARLIQLQLCIIYFYTGMEKLRGASWWDGTALWTVLANPQMVLFDFSWLKSFPYLIVLGTFTTILFEIYFLPLVWIKKSRPVVLWVGVIFHLGIGFVMALYTFALTMIAPYFLFVDLQKLETWHTYIISRGSLQFKNIKLNTYQKRLPNK